MTAAHETPPPPETLSVLLPLPLPEPYDYLPPETGTVPRRGDIVVVPLGARAVHGLVLGPGSGAVARGRLKAITGHTFLALREDLMRFLDWMAAYVMAPRGSVLALALRAAQAFGEEVPRTALVATGAQPDRMTAARARVLDASREQGALSAADLARAAGVSAGVVGGLIEAGALTRIERPEFDPPGRPDPNAPGPALGPEQAAAAEVLRAAVKARAFSVSLLDGVTGSGKTETYFEAVAACLREGRQALILLPEIALTHGFLERFVARFGARPLEWHSGIGAKARRRVFRQVARGEAQVVVGARSALFLPFPDLGLLVIDEEHETSFKQEDGVVYHARDMAIVRARMGDAAVLLASATPSLESFVNARSGRYRHLVLPRRFGPARMPAVAAIDLKAARLGADRFIAPELGAAVDAALAAGEQALLFLNRRGYAPLTLCRACGTRIACPSCSAWLVEHRYRRRLVCHHCGFETGIPQSCSACGAQGAFVASGPGVERIAEEAAERWPQARIAIASSDAFETGSAARDALLRMADGETDILIGTQIVAKGHHFPKLTLVGVIDADLGLSGADPRARERTFQLLHQVAGRAGRAEHPGRVLLQTHRPDDRVIAALIAGDRDAFLEAEADEREALGLPPFGRLAAVVVSGPDGAATRDFAAGLAKRVIAAQDVAVYGPADAALVRLRGRTRLRFLVHAGRRVDVQAYLGEWLGGVRPPGAIRVQIDIDPISFL